MKKTASQLAAFFPPQAAEYAISLWVTYDFHLIVSKTRVTKRGDYRFRYNDQYHTITVNQDLNPYAFLITYLHEVAHMVVQLEALKSKQKHAPHGVLWKQSFAKVAEPVLHEEVFPRDILSAFRKYLKNPKASSVGDPGLIQALSNYDPLQEHKFMLSTLPALTPFLLNGKTFVKLEKKRSRYLCEEVGTKKKYLVHGAAQVEKVA